jgi:8-oxo-dGTP pyrophosphatase MutT (NUDIX family)
MPIVKASEAEEILQELVEAAGILLFAIEAPPKFLLMRHRDRWDLPKGHAEVGEEILTTALRETEEETGVPASAIAIDPDFRFVLEYSVTYRNRGQCLKRVTYFLGYLPKVRPIAVTEHESYSWWVWPQTESLQKQTIDPLLKAARDHFEKYPQRLTC